MLVHRLEPIDLCLRPVFHALVDVLDPIGRRAALQEALESIGRIQAHQALIILPVFEGVSTRVANDDLSALTAAVSGNEKDAHYRNVTGIPHVTGSFN